MDYIIQTEKLKQAVQLLQDFNVDMWLTFVRETPLSPDPCLDLIYGANVTWQSAFIVTQTNQRIAIVGRYDAEDVQKMGAYTEIITYDEGIEKPLVDVIKRLDPNFIAVNYSEHDVSADGLSHGMWLLLNSILAPTPYKHRLVSAEKITASLRGRKTISEIQRVRAAVRTTEEIVHSVTNYLSVGQSALEIHDYVQQEMQARGVLPAWKPCPMVTPGPDAPVGHASPSENYKTQAGHLLHMDLGVQQNGYVSDIQRVWYFKAPHESGIPEPVQAAFDFVRRAIDAAAKALKIGAQGWEVDAAARTLYAENKLPDFGHATGHHIGRSVHDGATILGPKWSRYGNMPYGKVELGNIFTLELHLIVPDYGIIGLEEDVLVKESGLEWLTTPQEEIMVID